MGRQADERRCTCCMLLLGLRAKSHSRRSRPPEAIVPESVGRTHVPG